VVVEPRLLQGPKGLCNSRPKVNIGFRPLDNPYLAVSFYLRLALRLGISRREEYYMSCKAVLQYQILQYGQKGCIIFELRLSRVPHANCRNWR